MVTINGRARQYPEPYPAQEALDYRGKSTDAKPTQDVPNGSTFLEIDTWNMFCWDAEHEVWLPAPGNT